ncbi:hypothetical protein BD779DRAFT_1472553 [Infundibulicybe gibba]|nr:hypothetical protein BD779DRAFT_1472553 [Infundibulicybe gibba]
MTAYSGNERKLVLAFDIGTTHSGISYRLIILNPGEIPDIKGVNRYLEQEHADGDSKIPTVIYYDAKGRVRAVGEVTSGGTVDEASENSWYKAQWFKMHLRPNNPAARWDSLPLLPPNKTVVDIMGDYMRYLHQCAEIYIQETHPGGASLWLSLAKNADFILSHPNGWEGAQQAQMRRAAILGGLVSNEEDAGARIRFVTEGEASLHFCVQNGLFVQSGGGVLVVDAGGGTIDLSAYSKKSSSEYEEIAPAQYLLEDSKYADDTDHIAECFDKSTKLRFGNADDSAFIKFGTPRDHDADLGIRSGQLRLGGWVIHFRIRVHSLTSYRVDVASFFDPSVQCIVQAIIEMRQASLEPISLSYVVRHEGRARAGSSPTRKLPVDLSSYLEETPPGRAMTSCPPRLHLAPPSLPTHHSLKRTLAQDALQITQHGLRQAQIRRGARGASVMGPPAHRDWLGQDPCGLRRRSRESPAPHPLASKHFCIVSMKSHRCLHATLPTRRGPAIRDALEPERCWSTGQRPDTHLCKAVADGAISFYTDHIVSARVSRRIYGCKCDTAYDPFDVEHVQRASKRYVDLSGEARLDESFNVILSKNVQVSEKKEFRTSHFAEHSQALPSHFTITADILCYRGCDPNPRWVDIDSVTAHIPKTCAVVRRTPGHGEEYSEIWYDIILFFGLTELQAQVAWQEEGREKRNFLWTELLVISQRRIDQTPSRLLVQLEIMTLGRREVMAVSYEFVSTFSESTWGIEVAININHKERERRKHTDGLAKRESNDGR